MNLKFNVHKWNGSQWEYIDTARANNEQSAALKIAKKRGMSGRFAAYPHIDNEPGMVTSNTPFTVIGTK